MKILNAFSVATLFFVALMLSSTDSFSQDPESSSQDESVGLDECTHPPVHVIVVTAGADGQPVLKIDGTVDDDVHVCLGDRVLWVLSGPDRELFVDFKSRADTPFPGQSKRNSNKNVINVRIGGPDAERGKYYKYDVGFTNGPSRDPQIIVE